MTPELSSSKMVAGNSTHVSANVTSWWNEREEKPIVLMIVKKCQPIATMVGNHVTITTFDSLSSHGVRILCPGVCHTILLTTLTGC